MKSVGKSGDRRGGGRLERQVEEQLSWEDPDDGVP